METTHTGTPAIIENKLGDSITLCLEFWCSFLIVAKQIMAFIFAVHISELHSLPIHILTYV
jgi:hypothetical protein